VPKIFGREISVIWIAAGAAAATFLGYQAAFPPIDTSGIASAPRKKSTASTKKKADIFVDNDYKVRYAMATEPIRDSFKPLITREAGSTGPSVQGGIPAAYAAGDGNWVYSGMATVNGVPQALLENRSNQDSEFVTRGERWKSATIGAISADSITLNGPGGMTLTLAAGGPTEPSPEENVSTPQPVTPTPVPGMTGQIGGNNPGGNWGGQRPRRNGGGGGGNGRRGNGGNNPGNVPGNNIGNN
jgi:hypothetical protein